MSQPIAVPRSRFDSLAVFGGLAELSDASAGCRWGKLRRMLGTRLQGRSAGGQIADDGRTRS